MVIVRLVSSNLTQSQQPKAMAALAVAEKVINSSEFQKRILEFKFSDVRLDLPDGSVVNKLTNQQIYNIIVGGIESGSQADKEIGIKLVLYWRPFSTAIGHTENGVIHTRDKFFYNAEVSELAGHWIHEWMHSAGFIHDYDRTARRPDSVPYAVGDIVAELGGQQ